ACVRVAIVDLQIQLQQRRRRDVPAGDQVHLDLKIDDGDPDTGAFISYPADDACTSDGAWKVDAPSASCSGAWIGF
ncbi:MAG: hypothetical protein AAF460_11365, partial [Pseudomonadota bacterium]